MLIPNPIETRGCVASWNAGSEDMTVWVTSQNPHICRVLMSGDIGVPEHKLRVIAPEVGGGFGSKIAHYADESIVAFCSMQLGRPVKWTESRSENYLVTTHGRDHVQRVEIAGNRDGTITGDTSPHSRRHGRLSVDRGAWRSDDSLWPDDVRVIQDR